MRSSLQVGLRWVIQNNASLCVAADKASYLKEDIDLFSWSLSAEEMKRLNEWAGAQEDPTRGNCV
jgi:diketogulonate reductase-like aldo/keto reductase